MRNTNKILAAFSSLFIAALACQNTTSVSTPEVASTGEPVATSLPSLPTGTDIPTALPAATLAPPLGMFPGKVAFIDTNFHLALIDMPTGEIDQLTEGENYAGKPFWSSNGAWITFIINDLFMLEVASGEVRQITESFHPTHSFIFDTLYVAPDGQFVIFEDDGPISDGRWDVYRVDTHTREVTNLTADLPEGDENPALSSNGTQVVFERGTGPALTESIWIMNADGSGKTNLTPNDDYRWKDYRPTWSPDGTRIAFFRSYIRCGDGCNIPDPTSDTPGWPPGLWAVNADGSGEELIAELPFEEVPFKYTWLTWSPDGQYLAYYWVNGGSCTAKTQVRFIEVATGEHVDVTGFSLSQGCPELPTWSPDSRALMFNVADGVGEKYYYTVYIAAVDGSGLWTLFNGTLDPGTWTFTTPNGGRYARWSP